MQPACLKGSHHLHRLETVAGVMSAEVGCARRAACTRARLRPPLGRCGPGALAVPLTIGRQIHVLPPAPPPLRGLLFFLKVGGCEVGLASPARPAGARTRCARPAPPSHLHLHPRPCRTMTLSAGPPRMRLRRSATAGVFQMAGTTPPPRKGGRRHAVSRSSTGTSLVLVPRCGVLAGCSRGARREGGIAPSCPRALARG